MDVLDNGALSMKNIQTSDAGKYTCRVKNIYGDDATEITLLVQREEKFFIKIFFFNL